MNDFNFSFYRCDSDAAFNITYDSKRPEVATLTTSNNSKRYEPKRVSSAADAKCEGGNVKFSTDGNKVDVVGTEVSLQNCKLQK